MASVHRRPGSKYWHAYFRDSEGKLIDRSTRLTKRKEAQRLADLFETAAQRRKNALHVRGAFASLFSEVYQESMAVQTVREFARGWLAMKAHETAAGTIENYRKTIEVFVRWLGPKADSDLAEVTSRDVVGFRNELAGKLSSASVNRYLQILKMFFKSAERDKLLLDDPTKHVELVKSGVHGHHGVDRHQVKRRGFTIPEIQAVLAVADPEWQSLIRFGLHTGQRLGDIARLT
jgi:integrase